MFRRNYKRRLVSLVHHHTPVSATISALVFGGRTTLKKNPFVPASILVLLERKYTQYNTLSYIAIHASERRKRILYLQLRFHKE